MEGGMREAAERLRDMVDSTHIDHENASFDCLSDMWALAKAYLAEHPADEDEPLTKAWLRQIGARQGSLPDKLAFYREDALAVGLWRVDDGWKAMLLHTEHWASCVMRGLNTRGDVRRLCAALGIELKGVTKGEGGE